MNRKILFSPVTMAVLLVLIIIALATATFIENDFGAAVARSKVYASWWMNLLWIFMAINLTGRAIEMKLYRKEKLPVFIFHIAFTLMIIGGGVTWIFGYEGTMHIREGESSSMIVTSEKSINITVKSENSSIEKDFNVNLQQKPSFDKTLSIENSDVSIQLKKLYGNAIKKAIPSEIGKPVIGFILSGSSFRGFNYISMNEQIMLGNTSIGFEANTPSDIEFTIENDTIFIDAKSAIGASKMSGEAGSNISEEKMAIEERTIYRIGASNLVVQEIHKQAIVSAEPVQIENHQGSMAAMVFDVNTNQGESEITLWENQWDGSVSTTTIGNKTVGISYGNKTIQLPFSIHLDNFDIERYPGSRSPSSFSSYVTLMENGQHITKFHIYMNNILKHQGFRFYQSSYDQDERGTILSVNHDTWGTGITYLSYVLLCLGIVLAAISKNSFFRKTTVKKETAFISLLLLFLIGGSNTFAQTSENLPTQNPVGKEHAKEFGQLLIQNNRGRTEPIFTFSTDILHKLARKESMYEMSPIQLFLEMHLNPRQWMDVPLIRVKNDELKRQLGMVDDYAAYSDFVSEQGGYKLQQMVSMAYSKPPGQRGKFDKEIMKVDEKVNICYGIFSGSYLKIFPLPEDDKDKIWYTSFEAKMRATKKMDSLFLAQVVPMYFDELQKAKMSGNYATANEFLNGLKSYQRKNAGYELPSNFKVNVELIYEHLKVFKKLFPFYATIGLVMLILLVMFTVIGRELPHRLNITIIGLMLIAFTIQTLAIVARWYISGHAPMSNGFESMIFISWVTILAGLLFSRQSSFALPVTSLLAGMTLMVANLSFMDPQITDLVPVLQSYWLIIHVSIITGSYSFLGMGAILGIVNLLLISLHNNNNRERIKDTIVSLTIINHKALIIGLYMLTIGTFLGAVWANESWGRYWGWDPKETWALISILVYTLVSHGRMIKGMKGIFVFNALSIAAFASILMTYFGVNYYLSGLHSYAGGDPVPVPVFVYYTVAALILLNLVAANKYKKLKE